MRGWSWFVGPLVASVMGWVVASAAHAAPAGGPGETTGVASNDDDARDSALTDKSGGCQWRVPINAAPPVKKSKHKHAPPPLVPRVFIDDVPCKAVKVIALRPDGQRAAITTAREGEPQSVQTSPGTYAMVYPLTYRMFEANLTTGKVSEFGLPRFEFPDDVRFAAAVGYNRRETLVIVAQGLTKNENTSMLQRFSPSRQGWSVLKPVDYKTDREQDPKGLCGDNFVVHATLVKDLVNWCVKLQETH